MFRLESVQPLPPTPNLLHQWDISLDKLPVPSAQLDMGRVPRVISAHLFGFLGLVWVLGFFLGGGGGGLGCDTGQNRFVFVVPRAGEEKLQSTERSPAGPPAPGPLAGRLARALIRVQT